MDKVSVKSSLVYRVRSWRLLFLVSLALNAGLLIGLIYDRVGLGPLPTLKANEKLREFCFEKNTRGTLMCAASENEAHGSSIFPEAGDGGENYRDQMEDGGKKVINLDHGDPTMYEQFWRKVGGKSTIVISGWQSMSYFSDVGNLCWFLEPQFAKEITRLHHLVGNAVTEDRHIVVGTGSTQLFQAALYALAPPDASLPINVVTAIPYYSSYPLVTDYLRSGLYKWAGDAYTFTKDEPYIELVTSPNNPDGFARQAVVNRGGGVVVYDLAYYWPQYSPITSPADHDLMLFTVSKSTGHAGTRIGWALVKDKEVAKKMTKFIELNTIGVSKDSQLRAAKIIQAVSDSCQDLGDQEDYECFFQYGRRHMTERWKRLKDAVRHSGLFSLPEFVPQFCNYVGEFTGPNPAFAWLKCEEAIEDCESFLKGHGILTRSGKQFGVEAKFARISMLDRDETFNHFVDRLLNIHL